MDQLPSSLPSSKRRRKHSPEFKAMVLKACDEPGRSTASVAQKYQVNANLIHKWRRQLAKQETDDFVQLAPSVIAPAVAGRPEATVRIELPNGIALHWPADRIIESIPWLKAIMP